MRHEAKFLIEKQIPELLEEFLSLMTYNNFLFYYDFLTAILLSMICGDSYASLAIMNRLGWVDGFLL